MLKTRAVLLAKTEVTYNTDPTPTPAANAILVENLSWSFDGARMAERAAVRASLAPLKNLYAGSLISITFDAEIKGSGAAGTAPEIGPLLRGCGFAETIVAATSVTYKPASSGHESLTFWLYEDGMKYVVTGCRGTVTGSLATGATGKLSFTFTGHFSGPTDVALATPTYNATVPPALINVPFSIDSYSAVISKLDFDMGLTLAKPDNIAATDGYGQLQITGRACTGTIDPEASLVAAYDWVTKWKSSAAYALTTGAIGGTAGNKCTISMPAVVYSEISSGDRDGILTREIKFQAVESSGDDEISLLFN